MGKFPKVGDFFASRYELLEVLGSGGGGTVFKARQADLGRFVALKILHPHMADISEFQTRFLQEAKLLNQISHPNIVTVYHFGYDPDGLAFVAMEFVCGINLRKLLVDNEPLPTLRVLKIIRQAANALAYVHSLQLLHRDIKPDNMILVDQPEPDTIKLIDFGLARSTVSATITEPGALIGTCYYISPEQAAGKKADFRSDMYSLTVCLYELLTGVKPFDANVPIEVMGKHIYQNVPALRSGQVERYHPDINKIIARGMAKNPDERFADMNEFSGALAALSETLSSVEPQPIDNSKTMMNRRRLTGLRSLLAVVACLAVAVASAKFIVSMKAPVSQQNPAAHDTRTVLQKNKTKRITCLQTGEIVDEIFSSNQEDALRIANDYLSSDRLDTKARAVLLTHKSSICAKRSLADALACAQQAFKLAERERNLYKDDLSLQIYISCAGCYLERLLAVGKYREALDLAGQVLSVTNRGGASEALKLNDVGIPNYNDADFRILAADAALRLSDRKLANHWMDVVVATESGIRTDKQTEILLALNRSRDLRQVIDCCCESGLSSPSGHKIQVHETQLNRLVKFFALIDIMKICQEHKQFDLAKICLDKAGRLVNAMEVDARFCSSTETMFDGMAIYVRSLDAYTILGLRKIGLCLARGDQRGAREEGLQLYEKWLKLAESESKRTEGHLYHLNASELVVSLFECGLNEEADHVLEIVLQSVWRYCEPPVPWNEREKNITVCLNVHRDDKLVRDFLERRQALLAPRPHVR